MPKRRMVLSSTKDRHDEDRKRELRRLRNISYRQRLKNDPKNAARYEKVKDDSRKRARKQTADEGERRKSDTVYNELSKSLWRLKKEKCKILKVDNNAEKIVLWEDFQNEVKTKSKKRDIAQQKRRRKERQCVASKVTELVNENEILKKKVNKLSTQLWRKRSSDDSVNDSSPCKKRKSSFSSGTDTIIRQSSSTSKPKLKDSIRFRKTHQMRVWTYRVKEFLSTEEVSKLLVGQTIIDRTLFNANRKRQCWRGRRVQKRVLKYKLVDVFEIFKQKYSNFPYTLKTFMKMRPIYIVTARVGSRKAKCICTIHSNILRKLSALNTICKSKDLHELIIQNESKLNEKTMCSTNFNEEFKSECINRTCTKCGTFLLLNHYAVLIELYGNTTVNWTAWENVIKKKKDKTGQELEKKYNEVVSHCTSILELIELLLKALNPFALHVFRAKWQWRQLKSIQENLPKNEALFIADFSENIRIEFSEESIASHVSSSSITLFVIALYRHSHNSSDEKPRILFENINILSNSPKHDPHLVHECMKILMEHCKIFPEADFTVLHRYTDGCAGQFRSRHCMRDIASFKEDFGVQLMCNYGETSEFKNITDGLGGVVKRLIKAAILSDDDLVLSSPDSLMRFVKNKFQFHSPTISDNTVRLDRRVFYFIDNDAVNRNRPDRSGLPLPGLLRIRCVQSLESGFIALRNLSCYCENCRVHKHQNCLNREYVDEFVVRHCRPEGEACCHPSDPCIQRQVNNKLAIRSHTKKINVVQNLPTAENDTRTNNSNIVHNPTVERYKCSDWVVVEYDQDFYPGVITDIQNIDIQIKCLENIGGDNYRWPKREDNVYHSIRNIKRVINEPIKSGTGTRQYYSITIPEKK